VSQQTSDKDTANPYEHGMGKTTVAPDVLITIAQLTSLEVSGVKRMANVPGGVNRIFKRGHSEGVRINIQDEVVNIDLYLILKKDVNMRETSRNVQRNVARAISEMVGMQVGRVNIHVEDIDFSPEAEEGQAAED
jgi:uncharacterized alkaline shock family protein YloU